ncbi:MAG TPA: hypothetical protein PLS63_03335 [Microthrixaceae bacterium]|nr:hypothetical protein [Microthrixaceae bacterium]
MTDRATTTSAGRSNSAAQEARLTALANARRPGTKRRHPAHRARIAAAGIGATTMLGLVGVMGYNAGTASPAAAAGGETTTPPIAPSTAPPPVVVVVHPARPAAGAAPGPAGTQRTTDVPRAAGVAGAAAVPRPTVAPRTAVAPPSGAATTLTARPTVRPATPHPQAPAATTHGSR